MSDWKPIGTVASIARFPVKALAGESLVQASLGWQGLDGDRRWALRRVANSSGLPWASARRFPALCTISASVDDAETPIIEHADFGELAINHPSAAEALTAFVDDEVEPFQLWRGTYDTMPISVITTESIASLAATIETQLDIRRFRSNVVIASDTGRPFPEEKLVGSELRFGDESGSARVRVDRKTERCNVIDVNPDTGAADLRAFAAIAELRRKNLGAYCTPVRPGVIEDGATVWFRR